MIEIADDVRRVRFPMLAISAVAWAALALWPNLHGPKMPLFCSVVGGAAPSAAPLQILLALNPPSALVAGWALMLVAMMSPLLIPEIQYIRFTSLVRSRMKLVALFVGSYASIWLLCGCLLIGAGIAAQIVAPGSYVPAIVAGLVAGVWQASPAKRRCLNKCHELRPLRVFGPEADFDAVAFGWSRGRWCAASCAWLMLVPMLLPAGHLLAMTAVAVLIFCERIEDPEPPSWKMRGLGQATRAAAARLRFRFRRHGASGS